MAYKNKVFVSFDGDKNIHYYRLMKAWKKNDNTSFNFHDAHDINTALDSSTEETIKRKLRERLNNSKAFILLVGESTRYLYKFVKWEIEQAISLGLPIIVVNLNGLRNNDRQKCPPLLNEHLAVHVSFNQNIIEYALDNWPREYHSLETKANHEPRFYNNPVYNKLGL